MPKDALCKENCHTRQHQMRMQGWHSSSFLFSLSDNTLVPVSQDCHMDPLHVPAEICDNGEDTVLTLILQEDVQQDATKFPVSYHQVSLLLCDFLCQ